MRKNIASLLIAAFAATGAHAADVWSWSWAQSANNIYSNEIAQATVRNDANSALHVFGINLFDGSLGDRYGLLHGPDFRDLVSPSTRAPLGYVVAPGESLTFPLVGFMGGLPPVAPDTHYSVAPYLYVSFGSACAYAFSTDDCPNGSRALPTNRLDVFSPPASAPVPEPGPLALAALGALGLFARARRQRGRDRHAAGLAG